MIQDRELILIDAEAAPTVVAPKWSRTWDRVHSVDLGCAARGLRINAGVTKALIANQTVTIKLYQSDNKALIEADAPLVSGLEEVASHAFEGPIEAAFEFDLVDYKQVTKRYLRAQVVSTGTALATIDTGVNCRFDMGADYTDAVKVDDRVQDIIS